MARIAVLDKDKCKPKRCDKPCYRFCPKVRSKIEAVTFDESHPKVIEALCVGCGICVKKCPFEALAIVNIPDELEEECSHRFGPNTFKLFRLPVPSKGTVLGLIGQNGIGKSTAVKILSGEIEPNLGNYADTPSWTEIIKRYKGSILQDYFLRLSREEMKTVYKPQYVDQIPKVAVGKVYELLEKLDSRDQLKSLAKQLQLEQIYDRQLNVLSGGELQRVAVAAAIIRQADVYLLDEPSSFLDVKQRLEVARAIRSLKQENKTIVVVEHDLAMLDYLSDQICIFYGEPSVYGVVSNVHAVRVGINIYLQGFIPDANVRFREKPIAFHVKPPTVSFNTGEVAAKWKALTKSKEGFTLTTETGEAKKGEVVGILGPNGIGKTTFIKLLAGIEKPDEGELPTVRMNVSYKPQYIAPEYEGTVEELLRSVRREEFMADWYQSEILQRLNVKELLSRYVDQLSGGELQRVAIATCLSREADLYLLDEPSAYLDVEERLTVARLIRRFVEDKNTIAFVVEHDVVAQDFIADRLMVFDGEPGIKGKASRPKTLREGMNYFLKHMGVTFRRDLVTKRPRVNKEESKTDKYQRKIGEYYYVPQKQE